MSHKPMTSRERVLCAFHRVPADRVPVNYLANPGIDGRLKAHFAFTTNDDEGLRQALGVDFRGVWVPYVGPRLHVPVAGCDVDNWGIHRRYIEHSSGGYWDYCDFPLREADEETVARWPMPSPDDFDYSTVPELCQRYDDRALFVSCYGDLINGNGMLRGMEQALIDLVTDDPVGLMLADRRFEIQTGIAERILEAAKSRIDFMWLGEDLGSQDKPMISMAVFRRHIRPRLQRLVNLGKAYGIKLMIHTCGYSSWAYEDFIEMGIDAVDTLQPECKDMSPKFLVKKFGSRLSFHGCISTAGMLATGKPDDVRVSVRDTLEIMKPTCSYMLAPTHEIQDNTPTDNVLAMYQAARELGCYE